MCSEAFVVNRAKREEIQEACEYAKSNIALPEDEEAEVAAQAADVELTSEPAQKTHYRQLAAPPLSTRSARLRSLQEAEPLEDKQDSRAKVLSDDQGAGPVASPQPREELGDESDDLGGGSNEGDGSESADDSDSDGGNSADVEYCPGQVSAEMNSFARPRPRRGVATGSEEAAVELVPLPTCVEAIDETLENGLQTRKSARTRHGKEL